MIIIKLNFLNFKIAPAVKTNDVHRKGFWTVKNENLDYNRETSEEIPYEKHCDWWNQNFDNEYMYIITQKSEVCGYIRLTKYENKSKIKHEISIALLNKYHKTGLGSYAYKLFEEEMVKIGIKEIIASTHVNNIHGQKFFEKNQFKKTSTKKNFITYRKKL